LISEAINLNNLDEYWKRRESISTDSGTTVETFKPVIPWQRKSLTDIRRRFDYSIGHHEVLLTGSVGSAKSLFLAHLAISHCIMYCSACVGIFRMAMPDLRDTIWKDLVAHLESENLKEGKDYFINNTRCQIHFRNGSSIVSRSFSDGRYTKVRSLRLSMAIFEEMTEFSGAHEQAVKEVRNRLGRVPEVCKYECLLVGATNPDNPSHWIYEYYIEGSKKHPTRHVYYSLTFDNPFLPKSYIVGIMRDLDEKQVLRMIFGRWLELKSDVIYYQFGEYNIKKKAYRVDENKPIHISWDFNIGVGKPFSCCMFQCSFMDDGRAIYHFFDEVIVEGMRTLDSCEQIAEKGLLDDYGTSIIVHGDAAGSHNDTRSKRTDYDIILHFLQNYQRKDGKKLEIIKKVPLSNPPIRTRHNKLNGLMKNALGEICLYVYSNCVTLIKGFKLTKLKDNGSIIEDDSPSCPYQHVTTAAGYGIIASEKYFAYEKQINSIRGRHG
jgi:PBSX family phage terminase large subunit